MATPLRLLLAEDNQDDADLVLHALRRGGFDPQHERIATLEGLHAALKKQRWDIVLADYNLGGITGLDALRALREAGWDVPFILVSGTIGEERAAESIKLGVDDYLLKDNLRRLVPAVEKVLAAADERRRRQESEAALSHAREFARHLLDNAIDAISVLDKAGTLQPISESARALLGDPWARVTGDPAPPFVHPEDARAWGRLHQAVLAQPGFKMSVELRIRRRDKTWGWFECSARNLLDLPAVSGILISLRDIDARQSAEAERDRLLEALRQEGGRLAELVAARTQELAASNARLVDSERRYRKMVDNIPGVVFQLRMRADGSVYYPFMSERVAQRLGVSGQEVIADASAVESRLLPEDEAQRREILQRSRETLEPYEREYRMRGADGTLRWLRTNGTPHRAENGETVWDGLTVDITEMKQREEELRAAKELVTLATQNIPGIVFRREITAGGLPRYLFFSGKLLDAFGITEQEALANPAKVLGFVHPEDRPAMVQSLNPALEDSQPRTFTIRVVLPDGRIRWIEIQSRADPGPDGRIFRNGIMVDVTPLKEAQAALAESEDRFRTVVNNVPGVVFRQRLGADGAISFSFWNEQLSALMGITPADALADPARIERLLHPDDRELRLRAIRESAAKLSLLEVEFRFLHPDGDYHWMHVRAVPHREADGAVVWDAIAQDVTDRRRLEENLRHTERLGAIAHLTDGIAHHFNNLLAIISGYAELLSAGDLSADEKRRALKQIGQAVQRGAQVVKELREFSQYKAPPSGAVSVNALVGRLGALVKPVLGESIELEFDSAADSGTAVVDGAQLQTAVLNLLFNARDALPEGGRITFSTQRRTLEGDAALRLGIPPGVYVEISVKDDGIGMTPEVLRHALNPFFTTKPAGHGLGLGLSMVHRFAGHSGGTMTVTSAPGKGTEVLVILPAEHPDQPHIV